MIPADLPTGIASPAADSRPLAERRETAELGAGALHVVQIAWRPDGATVALYREAGGWLLAVDGEPERRWPAGQATCALDAWGAAARPAARPASRRAA
jgi:hypothetical protein